MRLEIEYKDNTLNKDFGNWLIKIITSSIKSNLNEKKLGQLDKYIEDNFTHLFKKPVTSKDIIYAGLKELVCDDDSSKLIIKISTNKFMQGLDRVRIETLCRLINYGNSSVKGYPIFTDTFNQVALNIKLYVDEYLREKS
jgi:hypothetical protein